MDVLREIYSFVSIQLQFGDYEWSNFRTSLSSLETQLLDAIADESVSEVDISNRLFRTDPGYAYFRSLKLDLRKKLSRLILHYDSPHSESSNIRRAYHDSQQKFAVFNSLRRFEKSKSAFSIGRLLIRQSIKYDFTIITIEVSRYLARYYSTIEIIPSKAQYYRNLVTVYQDVLYAETNIEWIYDLIVSNENLNFSFSDEVINYFNSHSLNESIASRSFTYPYFYGMASALTNLIFKRYQEVIKVSRKTYEIFEKKKYDHQVAKGNLLDLSVRAYVNLGQLVEAQQTIPLLLKYIDPSRNNWFRIQDTYIRTCLAAENYEKAAQLSDALVKHKNFKNQSELHWELWMLYRLYIDVLVKAGHIENTKPLHKKTINKFFRNNNILQRNAQGSRISYIILELLYNILDRDYDAMESRIASLREFCSKYLKKDSESYRSNCFIKMLLKIPVCHFHPVAVERKTQLLSKKLSEIPFNLASQNTTLEILPYEFLWKIIISHLKTPSYKRKNPMPLSTFELGRKRSKG